MTGSTPNLAKVGGGAGSGWWVVAVVAPVAVVALAYVLWRIDDRLLYVGPLDRAQFGWLVVIPTLLLAAVVGAFAWARLPERRAIAAAVASGAVVGAGFALLYWESVSDPGCPSGNRFGASDWVVPSLIVGAAFGASLVISGIAAARFVRSGRRWTAIGVALGVDAVLLVGVLVLVAAQIVQPMCNRPIPTA